MRQVISDIRVESSGGDGIYIQNASDVSVIRVDSNDHYRQGMSVIDVSGLTVLNSSFRNTNGTAPMAGIDIEPSNGIDQIEQIKISNCLMAASRRITRHHNLRRALSDHFASGLGVRLLDP